MKTLIAARWIFQNEEWLSYRLCVTDTMPPNPDKISGIPTYINKNDINDLYPLPSSTGYVDAECRECKITTERTTVVVNENS